MPKTDSDPIGDQLQARLRAELDRVQPRWSPPRYLSPAPQRIGAWRLGPPSLVAAIAGTLALTAYVATGSPNPAVWTQRIVTTVVPNAGPESTPLPTPGQTPSPHAAAPAPAPPTERTEPTASAEPSEPPEASPTPEPSASPEPGDSHDGEQSPLPSPSPSPGDH